MGDVAKSRFGYVCVVLIGNCNSMNAINVIVSDKRLFKIIFAVDFCLCFSFWMDCCCIYHCAYSSRISKWSNKNDAFTAYAMDKRGMVLILVVSFSLSLSINIHQFGFYFFLLDHNSIWNTLNIPLELSLFVIKIGWGQWSLRLQCFPNIYLLALRSRFDETLL